MIKQLELDVIKEVPRERLAPIRVSFSDTTFTHLILTMIAKQEGVSPGTIVRAMVKAALVQWLKHNSNCKEVNIDVKGFIDNEQL
jgi:hypothetical protein